MKHPCPVCGRVRMAHPSNRCADCEIAVQRLGGRDLRPADPYRWEQIADSELIIRGMVAAGTHRLVTGRKVRPDLVAL